MGSLIARSKQEMNTEKSVVLITGGNGYLGGRLANALSKDIDLKVRLGDIVGVQDDIGNCEFVSMDLMDDDSLRKACKGVHFIVHLAAMNEIQSVSDPEKSVIVNGIGTYKLLKAAISEGVKRIIYFSTIHVYGSPLVGTITENTVPRPVHPYAYSKRLGEDFVLEANNNNLIEGVVLRLSNSFGYPVSSDINRWALLVNDLCRQVVATGKLTLRSSGIQIRDFITLTDVCRAASYFLTLPIEKCLDGLFNLGGECSMSINDIAKLIADRCRQVLGFMPVIDVPKRKGDDISMPLEYSIDKIQSTGFKLKRNMVEEIDSELEFCKNKFSANSL